MTAAMARARTTISIHELPGLLATLQRMVTDVRPLLRDFGERELKPIQERHMRSGWGGGVTLHRKTIKARASRRGYYRRQPAAGARAAGPPAFWTGRFFEATRKITGTSRQVGTVRRAVVSVSANYGGSTQIPDHLARFIRRKGGMVWAMRELRRGMDRSLDRHAARVVRVVSGGVR